MTTAAETLKPASEGVNKALSLAARARETARRHQPEVLGRDVDPDYCLADYLLTVKQFGDHFSQNNRLNAQRRLEGHYKAAMAESSGVTGGYVVPPDFQDRILEDISGYAAVRPRATVIPMNSRETFLPTLDATTVPGANGTAPFWGGMRMQFALEGQARAETEPKFRQVALTTSDLGGYAIASNPLMQDGMAIEQWLRTIFARSAAWYEDWYFLNGNGVGQPLGVINAGAALLVSRNTASHFKVQDGQGMLAALYNVGPPVWLIARGAAADVVAITGWVPNDPLTLYGAPIEFTLKQPALGTQGDAILADLSLYVIGDRKQISIDVSYDEPTAYLNNQAVWRVVERVAGAPWISAPITIPDAALSTTVSPFVILK